MGSEYRAGVHVLVSELYLAIFTRQEVEHIDRLVRLLSWYVPTLIPSRLDRIARDAVVEGVGARGLLQIVEGLM